MCEAPFDTVIRQLTQDQTPRVWSLLISVFGDLAQQEDARISGGLLRLLTERIGIKPEAMRVAIHRLRKEGWIESKRSGRTSNYSLTPWGRQQSAEATPRIYAAGQAAERAWLVLLDPAEVDHCTGAFDVWVSSNAVITSRKPQFETAFATELLSQARLPEWMTRKVCGDATLRMGQTFGDALEDTKSKLTAIPQLSPIDTAVLRVLLVHGWRRIVLKTPVLPDHVFPQGWCGPKCRETVSALLAQYPNPKVRCLEALATNEGPRDVKARPGTATAQS